MLSVHLNTLGTTVVRAGAGVLDSVVVNRAGDKTAHVIAVDGIRVLADLDASVALGTVPYGAPFNSNLTVTLAGAKAPDVTVVFS